MLKKIRSNILEDIQLENKMKDTKTAFTHFDDKGLPHFDFSSIIPMPKVIPPKEENSSFLCTREERSKLDTNK